jgi:mono/diheme cytochrome c family protein
MRALFFFFAFLAVGAWSASTIAQAQQVGGDDVQNGHHLAVLMCSNCHVIGPGQSIEPILQPPAPSFESIAQRSTTSADTIRTFLTTTHRNLSNAAGMPNPELLDFQTRQVEAYLLSLRKPSAAALGRKPSAVEEAGSCSAEITRLELRLTQARASGQAVGSAPESSAARLHRQPTAQSVEQAATEVEKTVETALAFARKLQSEGLDAECAAMLKKIEPTGSH